MYRSLLLILAACGLSWADTGFKNTILMTETDGSPMCVSGAVRVQPGQLACSGNVATLNITGTGGGGASTLEVLAGVQRTSPTVTVGFPGPAFAGAVTGSSMTVTLSPSSVTLQGQNVIFKTSTLQTGATFYTSSGTVNTFNIGTSIRWPDGTVQVSSPTAGGGGTPASPANSIQFNNAGAFGGDSDFMFYGDSVTVNSSVLYMPGYNVYLGAQAGGASPPTSTEQNTCVGNGACKVISTGKKNTCIGSVTCDLLTTGLSNTFIGQGTGADIASGVRNVCIGGGNDSWQTCQSIVTGSSNTMVGVSAGSLAAGSADAANTFIGFQAGQGDSGGPQSSSICIGAYCTVTGSNQARIGGRGAYDVTLDVSTMTISSVTIQTIYFPDGTSQTTAPGTGGGIVSPGTFTWTNTYGMSLSTVAITSLTSGRVAYVGSGDQIVDSSLLTFNGASYGYLNIGGGTSLSSTGINIDNGGAGGTHMLSLNASGGSNSQSIGFYLADSEVGNFGIYSSGDYFRWRLAATTDLMTLNSTPVLNVAGASADVQVNSVSVCLENGTNCPASGGGASSLAVFEDTVNVSSPTAILKFEGGPFNVTLPAAGTAYIQLDASSVTLQGQGVIKLTSALQTGATFFVSSGTISTLNIADAGYIKSLSAGTTMTIDTVLGGTNNGLVIRTSADTAAGIPYAQLNETKLVLHQAVAGAASYSSIDACNGTNCNYLYSVDPSYSSPSPGWYFNNSPTAAWGMYVGSSSTTIKSPSITLNGWTRLSSSMTIQGAGGLALTYGVSAATAAFTTDVLVNSQSVCLKDGTNCPVGGAGDMVLASTQTSTGHKTFQSSTTLSGGIYISSTVLLSGAPGTSGQKLTSGGAGAVPSWASETATVGISYDGAGSALTAGSTRYLTVPYAATIIGWTLTANTTGSMQISVKKGTGYDSNPTTYISGTEIPTLSSVWSNQDLALGTWTTAIASGDKLAFVLDSASTVTAATLVLHLTKP